MPRRASIFAALAGCAEAEVDFTDGFFVSARSNLRLDIFDIARAVGPAEPALAPNLRAPLASEASFSGRIPAYPTGAAVCEVEIDPQTGAVALTRYTTVDDCGRPINPLILHGQVHGGIVQGAGQALSEAFVHDAASAQVLSASFMDYAMPRADQVPSFNVALAEDPTAGNPLGVKGGGEAGITPALAVDHERRRRCAVGVRHRAHRHAGDAGAGVGGPQGRRTRGRSMTQPQGMATMIVDFQHHFTPRELIKDDPGDRLVLHYDENGAPSYTVHALLYDLDEHIRMMDAAGIDAAWLTSAAGMSADLERSKICNQRAKAAERAYPGRFIGAAHVHPLGGPPALKELNRCRDELGFQGVVVTSEADGLFLDAADYEPFWAECERLGLFVFIHPALKLNYSLGFDRYDTARSVGREFSLIMATIRLINSGVFDRHPRLIVHMAHLAGGIASMLGRVRSYQDKTFWGTAGNPRHGVTPLHDFDHYLAHNMVFDTAGFCGAVGAVKTALVELPVSRIVFATDYPQEIRARDAVAGFVRDLRALGEDGERILSGNVGLLLNV